MSLIVMKFGGTSVGSAERIRQAETIASQHAKRGHKVVVVVSALSKITDLILNILNSARLGKGEDMKAGLAQLRLRHKQVLEELCHGEARETVGTEVEATLRRIEEFCSALLLLGSATPQVMDMVLPLGEQISARLFAACLKPVAYIVAGHRLIHRHKALRHKRRGLAARGTVDHQSSERRPRCQSAFKFLEADPPA